MFASVALAEKVISVFGAVGLVVEDAGDSAGSTVNTGALLPTVTLVVNVLVTPVCACVLNLLINAKEDATRISIASPHAICFFILHRVSIIVHVK